MTYLAPEVKLGQFVRKQTHIKHFYKSSKSPRKAQESVLLKNLSANKDSLFGRKHNFARIKSIKDFQNAVPPCNYQDIEPYIEALKSGQKRQLTSEEPVMFATTSGTTARPKYIPITNSHLRDYTHAFQVHNYHLIDDYRQGASGRYLIISSDDQEGHVENGLPYGAVSGLLNRKQSKLVKKYFALPYEICKIKDVESKYYTMLQIALCQPVTAILACNPASILLLTEMLQKYGKQLIADIYQGKINKDFQPKKDILDSLAPYIRPDPIRARQLEKIFEDKGKLEARAVFDKLCLLSCWLGGSMSFYQEQLKNEFGDLPIRDFGYMASEGRGTIPLNDFDSSGVLALTSHFFEFQDINCNGEGDFLTGEELEIGRRYYIYFTTRSGLYRYNINDIVEVTGFFNHTPKLKFIGKGSGITSLSGEKLSEEQVKIALSNTLGSRNLDNTDVTIKHATAIAVQDSKPYYLFVIEASKDISSAFAAKVLSEIDSNLQKTNIEYMTKRQSNRLGSPRLGVLKAGSFAQLRQQRVAEGAPEAQVKIPLLNNHDFLTKIGQPEIIFTMGNNDELAIPDFVSQNIVFSAGRS